MNATLKLAKKIRQHALNMTSLGKSSHIGSILSMADIVAVLYGDVLNVNSLNPEWKDRDRFILSKGHAGAGIYAALAEKNFFPVENLKQHYQNGSIFSGHVSHKGIPGIEFSTGSLGHGLPVAVGLAKSGKIGDKHHRIFCLMSDGECDEGSNWEGILFASHHQLNNLVAIIDHNKLQSLATVKETLNLEPFAEKWRAFGWEVIEVDGHSHSELKIALTYQAFDKPLCIIAHTIKGKGVSFMENSVLWHYRTAQGDELLAAKSELDKEQS